MDCLCCCCYVFSLSLSHLLPNCGRFYYCCVLFFLLLSFHSSWATSLRAFEYTFLVAMCCVHVYLRIAIRGVHTHIQIIALCTQCFSLCALLLFVVRSRRLRESLLYINIFQSGISFTSCHRHRRRRRRQRQRQRWQQHHHHRCCYCGRHRNTVLFRIIVSACAHCYYLSVSPYVYISTQYMVWFVHHARFSILQYGFICICKYYIRVTISFHAQSARRHPRTM